MKVKCPGCGRQFDVKDAVVLQAAGAIVARRRRRAGNELTPERAKELQAKSAAARRANAAKKDPAP